MGIVALGIIKNWWKGIVIAILLLFVFIGWQANGILSNQNKAYSHLADSAFSIAKHYHNRNGELIQQVRIYELTARDFKEIGDNLGFANSELKKQVGNYKNLVAYWQGQAGFKGVDSIRWHDSTRMVDGVSEDFKTFGWSNGHLTINEDYYPADNVVVLEYEYDLGGFELVAYRKKEKVKGRLFKKKVLVADIKFGDQNIKVDEFKGIVIRENDGLFARLFK